MAVCEFCKNLIAAGEGDFLCCECSRTCLSFIFILPYFIWGFNYRFLISLRTWYVGRAYEQLVDSKARYRTTLVKIPTPEFYVFYNGEKEQPLEQVLTLSDAFMNLPFRPDKRDQRKHCPYAHGSPSPLFRTCLSFIFILPYFIWGFNY